MSTTNPSSNQPVQPAVGPTVGQTQGELAPSKYRSGVTEEEIQIALKRRAEGGEYWTTAQLLEYWKSLDDK